MTDFVAARDALEAAQPGDLTAVDMLIRHAGAQVGAPLAASEVVLNTKVTGDTFNRLEILADGTINQGSGSSPPTAFSGGGSLAAHEAAADPHTGYVLQSDLVTEVDALVTPLVADPSITLSGATIGVNRLFGRVESNLTNVATSSTVLTDVTGLSVTVEAGATYELRGLLIYSCSTAADMKVGFSTPAGVTGQWTVLGMNNSATANTSTSPRWQSQNDYTETNNVGGAGVGITSTSTRSTAFVNGIVIVDSTAGTFKLQVAQQVSDATALAIGVGSYIVLERIA